VWFELYATGPRQYRWRLTRASGEVLATSEVYTSKKAALRAVDEIMHISTNTALVDRTTVPS
jgi:uncharacterized protein YegP (UPF0339 family)